MKDVHSWLRREEFAKDTGQRGIVTLAAMKDAQTMFRKEEFVSSMGQRGGPAVMKDVPTKQSSEEFALSMVPKRLAVMKDVRSISRRKVFVKVILSY